MLDVIIMTFVAACFGAYVEVLHRLAKIYRETAALAHILGLEHKKVKERLDALERQEGGR